MGHATTYTPTYHSPHGAVIRESVQVNHWMDKTVTFYIYVREGGCVAAGVVVVIRGNSTVWSGSGIFASKTQHSEDLI